MTPPQIDYLLIGHLTADLNGRLRLLGGTVSYAARTAGAFGLRVGILTSAAPDDPLLRELNTYAHVINLPAAQTSTFENIYQDEHRTQFIHAVARKITSTDVPSAWRGAKLVHIAPMTDEVEHQIVHNFKSDYLLLTPQGWMRQWGADGRVHFKRWFDPAVIGAADCVIFSEEDITPAPELEAEYARTARTLIVTRGYNGGTYYYRQQGSRTYAAVKAQAIDPTGAGDIFAASFLAALHEFKDFERAVQVAAGIAAQSTARIGLEGTPTKQEINSIREVK